MSDTTDTTQTQGEPGGCNTSSLTPQAGTVRSRHWFMTWNSFPENWKEILTQDTDGWVGQVEEGAAGNRHVQATMKYKNPRTFETMKRKFPGAHLEITKNVHAAEAYCTKEETRIDDGPTDYFRARHIVPKRWQANMLDVVSNDPDDRAIHWIWSTAGGVGKSVFVRHLVLAHKALVVSGVSNDVKYACAEFGSPKLIVFDLPRGACVDYRVLEEVKNGVFFSGKYESKAVVFDYPHIIVFANFPPNTNALSGDRWRVECVDEVADL